ncbi:MAG: hypothetical protein VX589_09245 [Myxococcota bacterium]|nr:hypothetical protein [Myxococcota bacterium]
MRSKLMISLLATNFALLAYIAIKLPDPTEVNQPNPNTKDMDVKHTALMSALDDVRRDVKAVSNRLDDRIKGLETRLANQGRISRSRLSAGKQGRPDFKEAETEVPATASIASQVVQQVEERLEAKLERLASRRAHRNAGGQWKASMNELAQALDLDDQTAEMAYGVFNAARDDAFALLQQPRQDGRTLLDDLVDDIRRGETQPEKQLMKRLFSQTVPGTKTTYMAKMISISENVSADLTDHLSEAQMNKLKSLNVALLEVDTGYDPVGDYVRRALTQSP